MTSAHMNAETSHKKPFFKRLISDITGRTKKERIEREEKEAQAKQKAVKEQLAEALSTMQSCADEYTPNLETKSIADLQKKFHAPRPENMTPKELRYQRWAEETKKEDMIKAEKDKIIDLFVQAKISGNKKDIAKYSKLLADLADVPKTRADIEKDAEEFRYKRLRFLQGPAGMTPEEAQKFYDNRIVAALSQKQV